MAILDLSGDIWREALDIKPGEEPAALILEGTWWRSQATETRLSKLKNVRELAFPDMFVGDWNDVTVAYCCAYGAARAVEPAHIFAQLRTGLLIQIGTCGALDVGVSTGEIVLPERCAARDGISHHYGAGGTVTTAPKWVSRAETYLTDHGATTRRAEHLTWPSLFAQSDAMCDEWASEGLLSVDMETSVVAAVADHFGAACVSMLSVWDALPHGRTFLDPLDPDDARLLSRSNALVYDAALALAEQAAESGGE